MTELIKRIYELKEQIGDNESKMAELKSANAILESEYDELSAQLLAEMKEQDKAEVSVDDLVAQYFCKSEFSYGDEKALLNYFIDKGMTDYITLKTSQSLNKAALKKDLKTNESLKESLKDYVGDRKVEYVVVTTEEKHQRMLEHIEDTMKGK